MFPESAAGWHWANLVLMFSPQMNKAIVYIEEMDSVADVTFPAVPQVVSLLLYDNTDKVKERPHPPNGYPVVCVTVSVLLLLLCWTDAYFQATLISGVPSHRPATQSTWTLIKLPPSALRRTSTTL